MTSSYQVDFFLDTGTEMASTTLRFYFVSKIWNPNRRRDGTARCPLHHSFIAPFAWKYLGIRLIVKQRDSNTMSGAKRKWDPNDPSVHNALELLSAVNSLSEVIKLIDECCAADSDSSEAKSSSTDDTLEQKLKKISTALEIAKSKVELNTFQLCVVPKSHLQYVFSRKKARPPLDFESKEASRPTRNLNYFIDLNKGLIPNSKPKPPKKKASPTALKAITKPDSLSDDDPPPENGTHYSLYEAISIVKDKDQPNQILRYWIERVRQLRCCSVKTAIRALKQFHETGVMPKKGYQNGTKAYKLPLSAASLIEKSMDSEAADSDPPPANKTHYSLYEIVSMLQQRPRKIAATVKRWREQQLILCSRTTVYSILRIVKQTGSMPSKDDYGCNRGRPSICNAQNGSARAASRALGTSEIAALPAKPAAIAVGKQKPVDMTQFPPPANGTRYSVYEAVCILKDINVPIASIVKEWHEKGLLICGRASFYKWLQIYRTTGRLPPKNYSGGKRGRPALQDSSEPSPEVEFSVEELLNYHVKMAKVNRPKKEDTASPCSSEDDNSK